MILVREVFQVKFGRMKEALALVREGEPMWKGTGRRGLRVLTDLTGPYYTLVFEELHDDLGAFERVLKAEMGADRWGDWYKRFSSLIDSGRREILTVAHQVNG